MTWSLSTGVPGALGSGLLVLVIMGFVQGAPPTFTNIDSNTVLRVDENASVQILLTVTGNDPDGDTFIFSMPDDGGGPFNIGASSGAFSLTGALDYETTRSYIVTLRITDNTTASSEVTFTIDVNDVNDNLPVLTTNIVDVTMDEEKPAGTTVPFDFSVTDDDAGTILIYTLSGTDANEFNIGLTTGDITLKTKVNVDPNPNVVYKPRLTVSDGVHSATATLTLTIQDINDNAPTCSPQIIYASLDEETTPTLSTLSCVDGDSSYNNNNVITYTMLTGNTSKFSVDATGIITVDNAIDYETTTSDVLRIRVADGPTSGKLSTTVTVYVSVNALNDNDPVWGTWSPPLPANETYNIKENLGIGITIFTMVATDTDVDVGGTVTYSATITDGTNPVNDKFNLDPNTGKLTTIGTLDRDGGVSQYILDVQATDGGTGTHIITKTITLDLQDINDNVPVFTGTPFSVRTIPETSAKAGSVVTTVTATDADATAANFTYTVESVVLGSTTVGDWGFSTTVPGRLEFVNDLDLDTGASALTVLKLIVKDGGSPELTGTATLTVSIADDNEFTPTITSEPGTRVVSIPENQPIGTSVADIIAEDSDVGDEGVLVYSISAGNTNNAFGIDSSGRITTQIVLDKETLDNYLLIIKIRDSGANPIKSASTTVTVSVLDVNDHQPDCTFLFKSVTVPENTATNSAVITIPCSDDDPDDNLTYTVKTPHTSTFGFTTPVNELKLIAAIDYDSAIQSYDVEIGVSDGTNTQTVKVRVIVGPVNEYPPAFASNPTIPITENTMANPFYTYTAVDQDYSPHDIQAYAINSVTNGGLALFMTDSSSGDISLRSALDYDSLPAGDKFYELVITATDGGGLAGTGTVTVSVVDTNDNGPTCTQTTYAVNMDETQTGTAPFTVVADLGCTDVEDAEDGTPLNYILTQSPGTHFALNGDAVQLTADTLDYESDTSHTLTIKVTDSGSPIRTSTVTVYVNVVNVNEGGPVFPSIPPVYIDETIGIGQSVADVVATDPDGSDPVFGDLQYSIISGNTANQFFIDVTSGSISTRKALDFETTPTYSLVVQAKERGGANSATVTQVINLNDINDELPVCTISSITQTVAESEAVDYLIVDFACTDKDAGTTLTYTISSGNTNLFKMDTSQLKLKAQLDFETAQSHDLTITVSDSDPSHHVTITGTINVGSVDEGPPVFGTNPYTISVNENLAVSSSVLTVTAADPDSAADANGQVKYSFTSAYPQFVIGQSSGQILLAKSLDRETAASHVLVVKAEDATSSATATVSITVLDSNDNNPVFTSTAYSGTITETDPPGTSIVTVIANDADDPATNNYGTVSYAMTGSSSFAVDPTTGVITNLITLDAATNGGFYTLTVTATDSGGLSGARTGTTLVTIAVTTVNQHDPVFSPVTTSVTITENQYTIGDIVATVTASDADSGTGGDFTLSFVSSQTKFSLTQNGDVGEVRLQQTLDFDSGDTSFTIEIVATDHGSSPRSATGTVVITVDDYNDSPPLCTSVVNVGKAEGQTDIATLTCSDADPANTLTYSIVSTTPNTISPSVSSSGAVSVATALDYETSTYNQILVQVQDNGVPVKSTTVTINLQITDLNDNDPTLTGPFTFSVSEDDTASSTVLYTANADSNDGPTDTLTYSLSDTMYFDIASSTGEITLKTDAPDYETVGPTYTMDLCVEDTPNPTVRTACETITVTVNDVNDMSPVFNPAVYSASVAENNAPSTTVMTVTATDGDGSAAFNTITFSIISGDPSNEWSVESTGAVVATSALDYETKSSYTLEIQASDGTHSAVVNCHIQVTSVNEFDPIFTPSSETLTVNENLALGTSVVITAVATDEDSGPDGTLAYNISPGPFTINTATGQISVSGGLDRETTPSYVLIVVAVDKGASPRTGTLSLTINLADLNDNAPSCTYSFYSALVPEDITVGSTIMSLGCTDDDDDPANLNNALTYTITPAEPEFSVDTSGVITSTTTFDRETLTSYQLVVEVADQSAATKLTFTANINVTILDVNDNAPTITTILSPTFAEDTALGTTITTVVAEDDDIGINKELQYHITNGNIGNKFYMDPTNGEIILQGNLDYDNLQQFYYLEITVMDKGSPVQTATGTVTVTVTDVNDSPPVCSTSLYSATIPENSPNTAVVTVTCTDSDGSASVTYSITAGNAGGLFSIDANTGSITTTVAAVIDYEATQSHTLTVNASDGALSDTTLVRVAVTDVNEFDPQFDPAGPYLYNVAEDVAVGYTITMVNATDDDTFDTVKIFSITAGNGDGKFTIDSATGRVKLQGPLDFEATQSYSLTLQVEDSGGRTGTVGVNIAVDDVNDNYPVCSETVAVVSVDEGVNSGTLYTPTCSDADTVASPTLLYTVTSGSHASINVDSSTGKITLIGPLDYETATIHNLVVQVSDQGTPVPRTTTFNVNIYVNPVNEFDPVFTPSSSYGTYTVPENTATGTSIAQVTATDDDVGLKQGTVRYSLVAGDPQQQFHVDEMTGDIKVIRALDYEATTSYTLTVRAMDDEPGSASQRSADATVSIGIGDINDNMPVFSPSVYTVDVIETAPYGAGGVLKSLTVQDDDTGANGATTISIVSGNAEAKFSISGNDLILSAQLDYETTTYYELILEVTDGGTPALKSGGRIMVNVLPANEEAPVMTSADTVETIKENIPVGTLVFDANATDSDAGSDGKITYSIDSGVSNNEFIIDPDTGRLYVGSQLDYDVAPNTYSIIIRATDGSGASDASTSTVSLSIILEDVNDHVPQFASTMFIFNVNEHVGTGTSVGKVTVTDNDSGVNGAVTLTKIGGNGQTYFDINAATGEVTTAADIDYEMFQVLYLSITAQDGGSPSYTSTGLVKIQVNNMNDNDPLITPQDFAVVVSEGTVVGTSVLTYTASDADTAVGGFTFAPANSYFQIDSAGIVTTKAALDREAIPLHTLYIQVIDQATSVDPAVRTFTATLTVIIDDINDNDPVITGTYTPNIPEDSSISTLVCTIGATDADTNENAQLVYAITAGNLGNAFKVDSVGNVQVAGALDRETTASYTLTIVVSDKGTPSRSAQTDIIVTIDDVNDNAPIFTQASYTYSVPENSNAGTAVGTVTATDADVGPNGALTYSFDSFSVGIASHFTIDGATGAISVASTAIDRETLSMYKANVKVTDAGTPFAQTAFAEVTINVNDVNDNAPVFASSSYIGNVDENTAPGTSIMEVTATDADTGTNAGIVYSIDNTLFDGADADVYLQIDTNTGIISPKTNIDYEIYTSFAFVIQAVDGGSPALTSTTTVTIDINDVNDNVPVFNPTFYNTEVAYAGQCQDVITTVSATDADSGVNGAVSYSLQTSTFNRLFAMDSDSGVLTLSGVASLNTMYALDIQAGDGGNPIRFATTAAKVRVDPFEPNDYAVTFRLKISRASFVAEQSTFLANLQTIVRHTYYSAIVRLWCIEEYEGTSFLPPSGRRRLLADNPVDVHLYVVRDDSSESISNLNTAKEFLLQDEVMALVAANPEGDPGSSIQGAAWDYYRIESVKPYYERPATWWETSYGIAVTTIACFLAILWLCLLTYFIVRFCCGKKSLRNKRRKKIHVSEKKPKKDEVKKPAQKNAWDTNKGYVPDADGQPYRTAFIPMLITDPESPPVSAETSTNNLDVTSPALRTPRSVIIDGESPEYNINNRQFDGRAFDHVTGKIYEYNTKTNERRWIT